MKYKYVFFDFNGTLLDDTDLCFDIENELLEKCGHKKISKEFYLDHFSFPIENYYKIIGFTFKEIDYPSICTYFTNEYNKREKTESALFSGVLEMLKEIRKLGYKTFVYSATESKMLEAQLKYYGILDNINGYIGTDNISGISKLDYGRMFIEKNKINPSECIMLGDTFHDYEVSTKLGFTPVLFSGGHNSLNLLNEVDSKKVSSHKEFLEMLKTPTFGEK